MSTGPTRGAIEDSQRGWVERPFVARLVRIVIFLFPIVIGWLAVRSTKAWYWEGEGFGGAVGWLSQAIVVAGLASHLAHLVAQRFLPLTALFKLTLVFPDHAPSRLGIALRSGTIKKLAADPKLSTTSLQEAAEQAVALVGQLGKHERLTRGHSERVRARAELIGAEMDLSDDDLQMLRWGVLLHDVGKLTVPPEILSKKDKLTDDEWQILKNHPAEGERILAPLRDWLGEWALAASEHHERWDGTGYPAGLAGEAISLAGRITAVADAYDVISSARSYKKPMSAKDARAELVRSSGTHFDPAVVRAALQVGMRETGRANFLGSLLEQPFIVQSASAVPSAAATVAAVAVATVVGAGTPAEVSETVPQASSPAAVAEESADAAPALAFEDPVIEQSQLEEPVASPTTQAAAPVEAAADVVEEEADDEVEVVVATTVPDAEATTSVAGPVAETTTIARTSSTLVTPTSSAPTTNVRRSTTSTVSPPTTRLTTTTRPTTTVAPTTTIAPTTTARPSSTTTSTTTTTTTTVAAPPLLWLSGNQVPASLAPNQLESDTAFYVIAERRVTLANPLTVRGPVDGATIHPPGSVPAETLIPAGTTVCSWLVHFDILQTGTDAIRLDRDINFGDPIIGLALSGDELNATDSLALPNVAYAHGHGVEEQDFLEVNGSVLSASLSVAPDFVDVMRVVTSCG